MNTTDLIQLLGDVVDSLEGFLNNADGLPRSAPSWAPLDEVYHKLQNLQTQLVTAQLDKSSAQYAAATDRLHQAKQQLAVQLEPIQKANAVLQVFQDVATALQAFVPA